HVAALEARDDRVQRARREEVRVLDERRAGYADVADALLLQHLLGRILEAVGPDDVARDQPQGRDLDEGADAARALRRQRLLEGVGDADEAAVAVLERVDHSLVLAAKPTGRIDRAGRIGGLRFVAR